MKYSIALLKSQENEDHLEWVESLKKFKDEITFDIIEFTRNDWLEQITSKDYDLCVCRPPGRNANYKNLYDERVLILYNNLKRNIYPSLDEILIYENKKYLSYYLKANNIPHPETYVFYDKNEALEFCKYTKLPVVAKLNIGAGGSGVKILYSKNEIKNYINSIYSSKGLKRRWYPNLRKGDFFKRLKKRLLKPGDAYQYFQEKRKSALNDVQKNMVILQAFIKNTIEWRVVKIGDSFFAHKKIAVKGELKSGTSKVEWGRPPDSLLDFTKIICDKHNLNSLSLDVFEDAEGNYYVNELQCFFGSKNPHQMIIDGKPGRFVFRDNNWIFEEGAFNTNNSFDLRVKHIISILNSCSS